ncbi:hypothetical protein V1520DRAFT_349685 [Lipomyces starkeyi]
MRRNRGMLMPSTHNGDRSIVPLGPLVYNGYTWFGSLRDAFLETYRETDSGVVKRQPVVSS